MRKLLIISALLGALSAPSTATAWTSNTFTSPTRNLRCAFSPTVKVITCMRMNDRAAISADFYRSGSAYRDDRVYMPKFTPFTPVLRYGQTDLPSSSVAAVSTAWHAELARATGSLLVAQRRTRGSAPATPRRSVSRSVLRAGRR